MRRLVLACAALLLASTSTAQVPPSAKALFYGPVADSGSSENAMRPVGFRYWFENAAGERFADAANARGSLQLFIENNPGGFLGVWREDAGSETMLTPMTQGYAGHSLTGRSVFAVPGAFTVSTAGPRAFVILFARSQTEQAGTAAQAREKILWVSARPARDGGPPIVLERETTDRSQIGTYVVHREGAQPGVVIELGLASN